MDAKQALTWALTTLSEKGYELMDEAPVLLQDSAWSKVYCLETQQGKLFLKIVPPALALEMNILPQLKNALSAPVPEVVAASIPLSAFLMRDAGHPLRSYLKTKPEPHFVQQGIKIYSQLQVQSAENLESWLSLGVPDWRLECLPTLYQTLLEEQELLQQDGLSDSEIQQLKTLRPRWQSLCERLSTFNIPACLNHSDFHDNNILIDTKNQTLTLIDWGESSIGFPFYSLVNLCHHVKANFGFDLEAQSLIPWLSWESAANLQEILTLVHRSWSLHAAFTEYRLLSSIAKADLASLSAEGRIARTLRVWLKQEING